MIDKELAKLDPARVFKSPKAILEESSLSLDEKKDILKRWAYDEREMAVAEEENMQVKNQPDDKNILDEILDCLLKLGVKSDDNHSPPTKQG